MSYCDCEDCTEYRMTGEVVNHQDGTKEARIRCSNCGGKVAYVPANWLADLPNFEEEDIRAGRHLSEGEQVTITIDLI